ncbi:TPA: hypothetical protein QDC51_004386 [Burkholderia multivorans]|uniref:hypothetical protein n=1 Tax=Burkholderia multivorans TaxID=87883 RepID=UPI001C21E26D|nr:hypothetical protein [Burkholderia multivorans]MBU9353261.1 hypothetical protein [Burkholderia multivorans]MBU9397978.1 hypothetical protein [Burkholderia multivorans]HDR9837550.1 hypothetical protein [Burkholderia multivorans]HDR9844502.1 hypothetical protein [Burkholderia multivorans]HDR9850118.1 hypothetical protein [Burkholderia multivorans]
MKRTSGDGATTKVGIPLVETRNGGVASRADNFRYTLPTAASWAACRKRADLLTRLRAREPAGALMHRCVVPRRFTTNAAKEVVSRASSTPRIADTI